MKRTKLFSALLLVLMSIGNVLGQEQDRVLPLQEIPDGWDNRGFAICWYKARDVMSLRGTVYCSPGVIGDLKMSPAATSFAVLYAQGKRRDVSVYSLRNGSAIHNFHLRTLPTAIAFSANAKLLCISDNERYIHLYNTSDWKLNKSIPVAIVPHKMAVSKNNYFIAIADESMLYVYNMETGKVRKMVELDTVVNHIVFSPDNERMAVLNDKGELQLYETKTFTVKDTYSGLGEAREAYFHPEGKYISVITADDQIVMINMKRPSDRETISALGGYVRHLGYAKPVEGDYYLIYNAWASMVFHPLASLVPDYQQLISDEVDEKMDEWLKQMPGETLEEYHLRVNEETRAAQYSKFEKEIATSMSGDPVNQAQVSFGNYDQEQNILGIGFDNMPNIYLVVPQEDVAEFSDPNKLQFENSLYAVTDDDSFELLYTEVINSETGKKYIYDNLDKQSLDYMSMNDNFVPLDLIQQSSMEEVKLQEIREEVVQAAEEAELISEHTHIDVNTKVDASTDAEGQKIMNYTVTFNYDVEPEYSSAEDFGPGKFITEQSESAMAMLRIVENAFENEFKQYLKPGKKVLIEVTGSADAAPIRSKIPYRGEYGNFTDALVYDKGELTTIDVTTQTGVTTNEQLAFLRAMGVKDYVEKHVAGLKDMQTEYDSYIRVSSERGAEFRRIGVKFTFIDAF